jgi:hypothetical protein
MAKRGKETSRGTRTRRTEMKKGRSLLQNDQTPYCIFADRTAQKNIQNKGLSKMRRIQFGFAGALKPATMA